MKTAIIAGVFGLLAVTITQPVLAESQGNQLIAERRVYNEHDHNHHHRIFEQGRHNIQYRIFNKRQGRRRAYFQHRPVYNRNSVVFWNNRRSYNYYLYYSNTVNGQYVCNSSWFVSGDSLYCNYNNTSYYLPYRQNYGYYQDNTGRQILGIIGNVVEGFFSDY